MPAVPTLLELQRGFADAMLDRGGGGDVAQWVVGAGLTPAARLQVYCNAIASTQIETLRTTYPAVRALVGEAFFEAAATRYRLRHPSTHGNLQAFGDAFAAFLATMPEAAALTYLPDVAQLEWLRQQSALAAEASPLDPATLDETISLPMRLHPSLRLLTSAHPVLTIWRYTNAPEGERLQLDGHGEQVALWRDGSEVAMADLDPASFACIAALIDERDLVVAHAAALASDGKFDLVACLHTLLAHRLVVAD